MSNKYIELSVILIGFAFFMALVIRPKAGLENTKKVVNKSSHSFRLSSAISFFTITFSLAFLINLQKYIISFNKLNVFLTSIFIVICAVYILRVEK